MGCKKVKNNFILFCREFLTESADFYLMSKFSVVFEISRQTYPKKRPFCPRKIPKCLGWNGCGLHLRVSWIFCINRLFRGQIKDFCSEAKNPPTASVFFLWWRHSSITSHKTCIKRTLICLKSLQIWSKVWLTTKNIIPKILSLLGSPKNAENTFFHVI